MGKLISGVIVFTLLGKILGFVRELLLSYFLGANGISDAYLISQTIPGTIFQFVGTGLTTCFIPTYYKVQKEQGNKGSKTFTNKVFTMILVFSTLVICSVFLFTPIVVKAFAAGFTGETLKIAIAFTRISTCSLYFSSVIYIYNSYLQANGRFTPTAAAAIPNSLVIIFSIIIGATWNVFALSIGSVVATFVQMLFLYFFVKKLDFRLKLDFRWKDCYTKYFYKLMVPVILGVSVNEINALLDKSIASQITVGGISALTYANSLIMLIQGGFAQPIATVFYPKITRKVSEMDFVAAKKEIQLAFQYLYLLLFPITIGFIVLSPDIVEAFFGRGAFDENAIKLTASALRFYAVGIVFIGIREVLARYYYAYGNTFIPMLNSVIGMAINIILNLTLSRKIGIGGLAVATSSSAAVTAILMWHQCIKLSSEAKIAVQWTEMGKIILSSILMGGFIILFGKIIPVEGIVQLIVLISVGIISYGVFIIFFKVKIVLNILKKYG